MTTRTRKQLRSSRSAAAGSWIALLAATTVGDAAATLRAEVRAEGLSDDAPYRLVVQSYDASDGRLPDRHARPIGSAQRAVTAGELREGVYVDLLELRSGATTPQAGAPVVVAWIEAGEPNLEFDGRMARPAPGSVYGVVKRATAQDSVQISLNRKLAV
jgi:hypothetical protein